VKDALIKFLKSKTFKALLAVVATALTAYATSGCAQLTPAAADVVRCAADRIDPPPAAPDAGL
jgi:hypothetical protein